MPQDVGSGNQISNLIIITAMVMNVDSFGINDTQANDLFHVRHDAFIKTHDKN
jgi:hypothetical protein